MNAFNANVAEFVKATNFAAIRHKDQRRKDPEKTPYINHPIGVANLLVTVGQITDVQVLVAAVLHDTVEDTETTFQEIEDRFGADVRKIVEEVTDDKSLPKEERKRLQIVHSSTLSPKAKLIKLADKIYNCTDLLRKIPEGWTEQRVQEYFEWASQVVKGITGINESLESEIRRILSIRNVTVPV